MPRRDDLKSVLVIGSGPIVIGQGCEFDYSGTQACRVLQAEGIRVSLVNSNPATIMTDPEFADATYVEPITPDVLEKVIAKERPDALLPTLGGQTALNAAVALHASGTLKKYDVELIGADIDAIEACEDRERFKEIVTGLGAEVPRSHDLPHPRRVLRPPAPSATSACPVGRPAVASPSAGPGSGIAYNEDDLRRIAGAGLDASPTTEVLLEESIIGWKEFELELMRDRNDNVVIVCSIENVDPMGVHTGDSVTVAPAMTLTDREYQHMRDIAIPIIRAVGVDTGGCNIQFAVDPKTGRMVVIEMNPRVCRCSRAGLQGHRLPDRQDRHQARDRLHPRRDPQRHHRPDAGVLRARPRLRGRQDPPVRVREVPRRRHHAHHAHEVGRRGDGDRPLLRRGAAEGPAEPGEPRRARSDSAGQKPTPRRRRAARPLPHPARRPPEHHAAGAAGRRHPRRRWPRPPASTRGSWTRLVNIHEISRTVAAASELDSQSAPAAKAHGFSDAAASPSSAASAADQVRALRHALGVRPVYHAVDTCAAEFAARTPYLYSTYDEGDEVPRRRPAEGDHPRQRPEPDRPGHRVRLRLRARLVRAARRRATRP